MKNIVLLVSSLFFLVSSSPVIGVKSSDKLLQKEDFIYLGAFRVPKSDMGGPMYQGLVYGGSVITYNKNNNSLYIVGHDHNQQVAEIGIPEIVKSDNIDDLNTASIIQNLADITEGNRLNLKIDGAAILSNSTKIGGLLRYNNKLLGSVYAYYDGNYSAVRSHFLSGLITSEEGDFEGMFQVGEKPDPVPQAGFVAGYMTHIPLNWQNALGGKVLTGMSALSILGRTSSGPAAFAFNPSALGSQPVITNALLYYPLSHQTIGTYYSSQTIYNKGSHHSGSIFPTGTKSIIYTGVQGIGEACYGPGSNIEEEHGNRYDAPYPDNLCMGEPMTNTADPCCFDPLNSNKGAHAYPYADYVWAYDAEDFQRVKEGGRIIDNPSKNLVDGVLASSNKTYQPWDIKPYAHWQLNFPYVQNSMFFSGASAYDEETKQLYIVQGKVDSVNEYNVFPVIHVFKLAIDEIEFFVRTDVNQDLVINTTDAMLTLRNSLGLDINGTAWSQTATTGDVNCDNDSNSIDAMLLLRYSLGLDMSGTDWCG